MPLLPLVSSNQLYRRMVTHSAGRAHTPLYTYCTWLVRWIQVHFRVWYATNIKQLKTANESLAVICCRTIMDKAAIKLLYLVVLTRCWQASKDMCTMTQFFLRNIYCIALDTQYFLIRRRGYYFFSLLVSVCGVYFFGNPQASTTAG